MEGLPQLSPDVKKAIALGASIRVIRDRRKATREVASSDVSYMLSIEQNLTPRTVIGWVRDAIRKLQFA